jgi:type III pantothenate kinase
MTCDGLLLVDIGNTRTKWAIAEMGGVELPTLKGEIATTEMTLDLVRELDADFPNYYLILSSVVPAITPLFAEVFGRRFHPIWQTAALNLRFDYPHPEEIGADRLAVAVAAHEAGTWPVIVVSCGTATAFTVLDAEGKLCGGVIAPGLHTQLAALLGATAQLPEIELSQPASALGKSTAEAIRAGVMLNFQGGINEILRQLIAALPDHAPPAIILTGGNASHLTASLTLPHTVRPLLVFEGLRIIGNRIGDPTDDQA